MSLHLLRSWAKLFSCCSPVLHQLTMSSVHSLHDLPISFVHQNFLPVVLLETAYAIKLRVVKVAYLHSLQTNTDSRLFRAVYNVHFPENVCLCVVTDSCDKSTQFHCSRGTSCISIHQQCDGHAHCSDFSDEADCCMSAQIHSFMHSYLSPRTSHRFNSR